MQYCKVIMCSYVISGFRNWLVAGIRTEKQYMYRSRVPASREMSGGGVGGYFLSCLQLNNG